MEKMLDEVMPVLCVEDDAIISKTGDVTLAYALQLPEIFTLSDDNYEAFHYAWVKAIRVLPEDTVLHKQDWFTENNVVPDFEKAGDNLLSRSSEQFFAGRPYLDHTCYLFLTRKRTNRKANSLFSNLVRPTLVPAELITGGSLDEFFSRAGQCIKILEDSGFVFCRRLRSAELVSTRETIGLIEQYCGLHRKQDTQLLQDMDFTKGVQVGAKPCALYTLADVADLPAHCGPRIRYDKYASDRTNFSIGFTSAIGQLLHCNHIYNQYVCIEDVHTKLKQLERKRLRLQSLAAYSRENSVALDATNAFLHEAVAEQRLPVRAHANVLVWTTGEQTLQHIASSVSSAFAQLDAVAKIETVGAPQIYWAGIPGNAGELPSNECFDTFAEQAACFFNLETTYGTSLSPVGLRLGDRLTGRPLHVDISDEPMQLGLATNRNKFILGPSGSGKSFFTNHMLRSYYEQGSHIVVVDVGHSYSGLCAFLNGVYFTYSETAPLQFNPFYISAGDGLDTEKKESLKTLLLALWKKDDEHFNRSEYVALSNALQGYYELLAQNPKLFPCFNSFYEYLQADFPLQLERDKVKERDFDVHNFLYVLRPFYKGGEFADLLNGTIDNNLLQQRFIVFELDAIKDHPILFPVVTIVLMDVFISKMRKLQGIRKQLLLEEVWKALMKTAMENAILYWVKTIRKFFGELILVTQDVEDVIGSAIVKNAIINNCDNKMIFDVSKFQNRFGPLQDLLGLTDKQVSLVLSINKANEPGRRYKEVFISLLNKVYRVEVSLEEYLAYTTEEKEKVQVMEYAKLYGSMQKGIAMLAAAIRQKEAA